MNKDFQIPPRFSSGVIAERGEAGKHWLAGLPDKIEALCKDHNLMVDGEPKHGFHGLVLPVLRNDEPCSLKITWPDKTAQQEVLALKTWDGNGAVKLLQFEPEGILLLERLDNSRTLEDVDLAQAIDIAGHLLRRLSVPAPEGIPRISKSTPVNLRVMEERWQQLKPFPHEFIEATKNTAEKLLTSPASLLVDYDIHFDNVLAGEREPWLVIDPKVISGDPEFGVFPLMLRRSENLKNHDDFTKRFDAVVRAAQLDQDRARGWTLVRAIDYWLWALSIGFTEDPLLCKTMVDWLLDRD